MAPKVPALSPDMVMEHTGVFLQPTQEHKRGIPFRTAAGKLQSRCGVFVRTADVEAKSKSCRSKAGP
eukprot:937196-Amphidinium_carterae.1